MRVIWHYLLAALVMAITALYVNVAISKGDDRPMQANSLHYATAVFAGGCFWCTESEFRRIEGVVGTRAGYAGGTEPYPTYEMVSSHKTDYAEVIEITFDSSVVTFEQLMEFFLTRAHDPTQLDRQGPDIGRQYRSAVFYHDAAEKDIAQKVIADVTKRGVWKAPIVTTLEPLTTFWPAEEYHQQYFEKYQKKFGVPHINAVMGGHTGERIKLD